jgi:CrcB protein
MDNRAAVERTLLIALGGAIGTVLRYLTSDAAARWLGLEFPYGTLIVNLVGSFLIGLIHQIGTASLILSDDVRLFLTTGVMGGLTTYSAFSYETIRLLEAGSWGAAALNVGVTTGSCLTLCFLGMAAARLLLGVPG